MVESAGRRALVAIDGPHGQAAANRYLLDVTIGDSVLRSSTVCS